MAQVGFLKGKVMRKIDSRIDVGEWAALALAVLCSEPEDQELGGLDGQLGSPWTVLFHRLLHPWNTQAVRLTGFELLLVLLQLPRLFPVVRRLVARVLEGCLGDDEEDTAKPLAEEERRRPEVRPHSQ